MSEYIETLKRLLLAITDDDARAIREELHKIEELTHSISVSPEDIEVCWRLFGQL